MRVHLCVFVMTIGLVGSVWGKDPLEGQVDYAKGLSLGRAYSKGISASKRELFLKGIRDGLENKQDDMSETEMNNILKGWAAAEFGKGSNKAAYAFGFGTGRGLLQKDPNIEVQLVAQGLLDSFRKGSKALTMEEANDEIMEYTRKANEAYLTTRKNIYLKNKQVGFNYLKKNKANKGIVVLDSGLQYQTSKKEDDLGKSPTLDNMVRIQVVAKNLEEQIIYDTEKDYKKPMDVKVSSTIKGWQEALLKMKPGDKWRLYVPEDLAFQEFGWKDKIAPGQTVIFDIELLSVH